MKNVIAHLLEELSKKEQEIKELEAIKAKQAENEQMADTLFDERKGSFNYNTKKKLKRENPEILEMIEAVEKLGRLIMNMSKHGASKYSPEEFQEIISKGGIGIFHIDYLIKEYNYCRELLEIIDNPEFHDRAMRKQYDDTVNKVIDEIDKAGDQRIEQIKQYIRQGGKEKKYDLDKVDSEIANLTREKEVLEKYLPMFKEDGFFPSFENDEELNEFYEWMKLNINEEDQFQIILDVSKNKVRKALEDTLDVDEIEENRKELEEQLLESTEEQLNHILDNIDLYNEEDRETIIKFITRYKELSKRFSERASLLDNTATLEDRKYVYMMNDTYNWESVLADLEDNILPNLEDNLLKGDKKTIDTMKYLVSLCEKEEKDISIRKESIKKIREYIDTLEGFMKYQEKYDTSQYDYVLEQDIKENEEGYPKGIPIEQIRMSYFLRNNTSKLLEKLKEVHEHLNKVEKERESLDDEFKERHVNFDVVDKKYEKMRLDTLRVVNDFMHLVELSYEPDEEEGIEFNPTENLVFCLNIDIDDIDENGRKEMIETLKEHEEKKSWKMKKTQSSELKSNTKNAKNKTHITVLSTDDYDAYRHRGTPDGRTGIIKFKLDSKIKKLLEERYNLSPQSSVYGIFNAINVPGADHNSYEVLTEYVKRNRPLLDHISDLLRGKVKNSKELFSIIDDGLEKKDRIVSSSLDTPQGMGGLR